MKKILIAALICAPMAILAQTTKPAATTPPGKGDKEQPKDEPKEARYVPEVIYADLILTSNNLNGTVKTVIRLDFGRDITNNLTDKELINQLNVLRTMSFATVPDALNYLATEGWKFLTTYEMTTSMGQETHITLEKRLIKRPMDPSAGPQKPPMQTPPGVKPTDPMGKPQIEPAQKEKGKG